jgi:hypothetical protein
MDPPVLGARANPCDLRVRNLLTASRESVVYGSGYHGFKDSTVELPARTVFVRFMQEYG